MALRKEIVQDDGIGTKYHRVLYVQITTNRQNSIAVLSYIDDNARLSGQNGERPYCQASTYETDYNPNMTVETAYDYLKTLPQFEDAEDV